MTPERWQRIEELYRSAQERSAGSRDAFLSEACQGDEELRRQVDSLLRGNGFSRDGLHAEVDPLETGVQAAGEAGVGPGTQLGVYRIESAIGAGGMGVVYKGFDTKLNRPVAVKLLSSRVADRAARIRFQREARMASSLNHPTSSRFMMRTNSRASNIW
jgi:serine/threonine protein kinase